MILGALVAVALCDAVAFEDVEKPKESPRNMLTEIRLGSYFPGVDRGLMCGSTGQPACPYQSTFGRSMLLFEADVERQLFQKMGSFALGLGLGYAEKYAKAKDAAGMETSDVTSLRILPMKALAVYRFDWLALKYRFPLVPFLKGAVQVAHWWSTKGLATDSVAGKPAAGWSFGLVGAVGLAFLMDVLDPRLARDFDSGVGVNHTYFFAEYNVAKVDGLGLARVLNLSDEFFMFGLAFEY